LFSSDLSNLEIGNSKVKTRIKINNAVLKIIVYIKSESRNLKHALYIQGGAMEGVQELKQNRDKNCVVI